MIKCVGFIRKTTRIRNCNNYNDWERLGGITTTIGKGINYNDWEKRVVVTTTNGIQIVVVKYNYWDLVS